MRLKNKITALVVGLCLGSIIVISKSYATTAIVNTDTLKLRKEASTNSTVLELLNQNQEIEVVGQEGDWYQVTYKGIKGYVHKDYIKLKEEPSQSNETQNEVNSTSQNTEVQNTQVNTDIPSTTPEVQIENTSTEMRVIKDVELSILPLINVEKIEELKKDTKVTIMGETNGWNYIATENGYGWIRKENLEAIDANTNERQINENTQENIQPSETEITPKTMYVSESSIYVRKGPSTQNEILTSLVINAEVTVIGEVEDWYKVKINEDTGYIAKRLLSDKKQETTARGNVTREEENEEQQEKEIVQEQTTMQINETEVTKGQEVVNFAKQYLGCKYVYGGAGPNTFDCSGFTMYVYREFGVTLSHSATAQSKKGMAVEKADLQPGDLVFFKDYETMDGIGHCGIYIGDGNFIHASSGTGYCVKISTLLSGNYEKRYVAARRVL